LTRSLYKDFCKGFCRLRQVIWTDGSTVKGTSEHGDCSIIILINTGQVRKYW